MFLALQNPELEPVVKNIPAIIKEASQSQRGIFALLIIVLFALALYFFRNAAVKWRIVIFLVLFGGVVAYGWEIDRVASKPEAMHYTGRVLDKETTTPIHEATVTVSLSSKRMPPYRSDSDGNFSFWLARKNATEDANVRIEHEKYQEYDRTVSSDSDARLGDISLVPVASRLTNEGGQSSLTGSSGTAARAPASMPQLEQREAGTPTARAGENSSAARAPASGRVGSLGRPPVSAVVADELRRSTLPHGTTTMLNRNADARPPHTVESSSGKKLSGKGKDWSPWYDLRIGPSPESYTVEKVEFWLTGDRSCGAWAECKEVTKNDNEVVWSFRLQGHDEWGAPPQAYSEGHLRVTYISK